MRDRQNLFKRYWDYLGGINGLALVIYSFIVIGIDVFFRTIDIGVWITIRNEVILLFFSCFALSFCNSKSE